MAFAMFSFSVVFLLITSGGLLLFYREAMLQRISDVINPQKKKKTLLDTIQETGLTIGGVVERFDSVIPKSKAEVSITAAPHSRRFPQRVRGQAFLWFQGPDSACALRCCAGDRAGKGNPSLRMARPWAGFLGPDFWLSRRSKSGSSKMQAGLPDVLDLLVICIEAGLSLDQATARTAEELKTRSRSCATSLELWCWSSAPAARAPKPGSTWRSAPKWIACAIWFPCWFSRSSSEPASPRPCGTRGYATGPSGCRQVEETAAKTTVKLVFPLVFFIFPALFLVVLGPAVIMMMDHSRHFLSQ